MSLNKRVEDLLQYTRRPNLRGFFCIPLPVKETSTQVEQLIKNLIKDSVTDFPLASIDRAHCIGRVSIDGQVKTHAVIVRFSTFRDRTILYRARKLFKEKKLDISLDLSLNDMPC